MSKVSRPIASMSNFEVNLIEVTNYLFSQRLLIAVASFATASIVGCWTFFFSSPTYKSTASVLYEHNVSSPLESDKSPNWSSYADIQNKLYVISVYARSKRFSQVLAEEALGITNIVQPDPLLDASKKIVANHLSFNGVVGVEATASYLSGLYSLSIDKDTNSIQISSHSGHPKVSQAIVNLAAQTLVENNYEIVRKEMNLVVDFIQDQVETTRRDLFALEEKLSDSQEKNKILNILDTGTQLDSIQIKSALHVNELRVKQATAEAEMAEIGKAINDFRQELTSGTFSPLYMVQLQSRIDLLLYQKTLSKQDRSMASVDQEEVDINLDHAMEEFKASLEGNKIPADPWKYLDMLDQAMKTAKVVHAKTTAKLNAIESVTNTELEKYGTLPTIFREINQVRREIERTSHLYQTLNNRLKETQIRRAGMANNLGILRYAEQKGQLVDMSELKKVGLAFLMGGLLLIMLLTLRYILIPTIRSRGDLQNAGVEVIAEIPYFRLQESGTGVNVSAPLLLDWGVASDEANAIRQARFSIEKKFTLQEYRKNGKARVLTFCSANSKEGKSFLSANLSYAMAAAEYKVLLIDFDVLNSSIPSYFDLSKTKDINFSTKESDKSIKFKISSISRFFDVIQIPEAGSNLSTLLETQLLGDYIESIRGDYDVILLDTPPIRNSLEALVASRFSSGMIFVANQRSSLRHDVLKTVDTLKENFDHRIFAVLNFSYDEVHANRRRFSKAA